MKELVMYIIQTNFLVRNHQLFISVYDTGRSTYFSDKDPKVSETICKLMGFWFTRLRNIVVVGSGQHDKLMEGKETLEVKPFDIIVTTKGDDEDFRAKSAEDLSKKLGCKVYPMPKPLEDQASVFAMGDLRYDTKVVGKTTHVYNSGKTTVNKASFETPNAEEDVVRILAGLPTVVMKKFYNASKDISIPYSSTFLFMVNRETIIGLMKESSLNKDGLLEPTISLVKDFDESDIIYVSSRN